MFRALPLSTLAIIALAASQAAAQTTVPEPRKNIAVNDPIDQVASLGSQWLWVYPASVGAPLAGTPFITELKLTLTPTSGTGTRIITVPRAQVVRETVAARCTGGLTPCLRVDDIAVPIGAFTLQTSFVSGAAVEGGLSTGIPFSGAFPAPATPTGTRLP